jgi:hypothetical protein
VLVKLCFEYYHLLHSSSTCTANHECHCPHSEHPGEHKQKTNFVVTRDRLCIDSARGHVEKQVTRVINWLINIFPVVHLAWKATITRVGWGTVFLLLRPVIELLKLSLMLIVVDWCGTFVGAGEDLPHSYIFHYKWNINWPGIGQRLAILPLDGIIYKLRPIFWTLEPREILHTQLVLHSTYNKLTNTFFEL